MPFVRQAQMVAVNFILLIGLRHPSDQVNIAGLFQQDIAADPIGFP